MKHPYRIREIAAQAGLSEATVDRVLHGRPGVRESTSREVRQAIADLDPQQSQVRLAGRTFMVEVVVQAPRCCTTTCVPICAGPVTRSCRRRVRYPARCGPTPSAIQVITPHNAPPVEF